MYLIYKRTLVDKYNAIVTEFDFEEAVDNIDDISGYQHPVYAFEFFNANGYYIYSSSDGVVKKLIINTNFSHTNERLISLIRAYKLEICM